MVDVFFSYAHDDKALVKRLVDRCEREGWSVWWDHSLESGEEFAKTIQERLQTAKCVVICWSKHSSESRWVRDEADFAVKRGVAVPVSLDGSLPPLGFGQFHTPNVAGIVQDKPVEVPEFISNVRKTISGGRAVALASGVLFRQGKPWSKTTLAVVAVCIVGLLVTAAAYSVSLLQELSKPSAPSKFSQLRKAEILMSEIDDVMNVEINDKAAFQAVFGQASDWIDVTRDFKQGANKIAMTIINGQYGGCGGRLEVRLNGFVAPEYRWSYGTANGNTEGRLPNIVCYTHVKTINLE